MLLIPIGAYFDMFSQAQRAYSRQLEPVCRKYGLTSNELDVLLFLYNNPGFDRAADIVIRRGMTKSHVSLSVSSLTDRGLLKREVSASDRRTVHLRLSGEGTAIAGEARQCQETFFRQLHQGLSQEEMQAWNRITQKVTENLERLNKTI